MAEESVLITGVGGFVGRALAKSCIAAGDRVVGIARGSYPDLETLGVTLVRCDLAEDNETLARTLEGITTVFHVAAKVDMWGRYKDFFSTNVLGTRRLLSEAQKAGVKSFVYTSSPSVIADGRNLRNVDESYPYPKKFHAFYPRTKAQAEQEVLAANKEGGFHTLSLRPHLIFGPGDRNFVPTLLERARSGRLVQVGDGKNLADFCYIDDCVAAHVLAAKALRDNPAARGRAYFISQGEPHSLWGWIGKVLELNGFPPLSRRVPRAGAMLMAGVFEGAGRVLGLKPQFTRFLVSEMTTDHYFNIGAARHELGYSPKRSIAEALRDTFGRQADVPR